MSQKICIFTQIIETCWFHICKHWFGAGRYKYDVEKWRNLKYGHMRCATSSREGYVDSVCCMREKPLDTCSELKELNVILPNLVDMDQI